MSLLDQLSNDELMAQFVQLSQTEIGEGAMPKPKQDAAPPDPPEELYWSQEGLGEVRDALVAAWGEEQADADIAALAVVTTKKINELPDSDFAYIEPGGSKDSSGKTVPRSLRHLPLIDAAHVRNALARIGQVKKKNGSKLTPAETAQAMTKIKAAAKKFGVKISETRASRDGKEQLMSLTTLREQYASDEVCTQLINQFTAVFGQDGELPEDQLGNLVQMLTLRASEASALQKKLEEKDNELKAQKEAGDTLKADLEAVKADAEKQAQTLQGLVASARTAERTAKADRLKVDLLQDGHWPNCVKIVEHYARQEEALNETFNGTKVEGEGDAAKPVKASLVTALLELMENIPKEARASAFQQETTSHESPVKQTDLDALHTDMKERGRRAAMMARGLSKDEMDKELQAAGLTATGLPK